MATKLTKAVKRELLGRGLERGKYANRAVIVTMVPGDMLSFRMKKTRYEYVITFAQVFRLAQALRIEQEYADKCKEYASRKKAGYKVKKPRKPIVPFTLASLR